MPSLAKFLNKAIGKRNIAQAIKSVTRRTSRLETRRGADAGIAAHQSDMVHSEDGVTYTAGPYPLTAILNWFTDDTAAKVARVLGYFVSGDSFSGVEIDAIAKTGSTVGDLVLAAFTSTNDIDVDAPPAAMHVRSDGQIFFYINGVEKVHVSSGGLSVGAGDTVAFLTAGTYSPTLTAITNIAASTPRVTQFYRIGNMVTVFGNLNADPTAAGGGNTQLDVSLPIASDLANNFELAGTGTVALATAERPGVEIVGETTNNRASFIWFAPDGADRRLSFQFSYQVQ